MGEGGGCLYRDLSHQNSSWNPLVLSPGWVNNLCLVFAPLGVVFAMRMCWISASLVLYLYCICVVFVSQQQQRCWMEKLQSGLTPLGWIGPAQRRQMAIKLDERIHTSSPEIGALGNPSNQHHLHSIALGALTYCIQHLQLSIRNYMIILSCFFLNREEAWDENRWLKSEHVRLGGQSLWRKLVKNMLLFIFQWNNAISCHWKGGTWGIRSMEIRP